MKPFNVVLSSVLMLVSVSTWGACGCKKSCSHGHTANHGPKSTAAVPVPQCGSAVQTKCLETVAAVPETEAVRPKYSQRRHVRTSQPHAVTYTSTRPSPVPLGIQCGFEQLAYDYSDDTYWLLGPQSVRSISKEQVTEYMRKNPIAVPAPVLPYQQVVAPMLAAAPVLPQMETVAALSPATASVSNDAGKRAFDEYVAQLVPPIKQVADKTKSPGWADYDGDGVIDEVFPFEKSVPNPEYEAALKAFEQLVKNQSKATDEK